MEFITSIEFYIIAFVIAFAIVGFLMKPDEKRPAKTYFATGTITVSESKSEIHLRYDGENLRIEHRGIYLNSPDCQINYSIIIVGNTITISEKYVPDKIASILPGTYDAVMQTDKIPHGKYHLKIESEWSSAWAATTIRLNEPFEKTIPINGC